MTDRLQLSDIQQHVVGYIEQLAELSLAGYETDRALEGRAQADTEALVCDRVDLLRAIRELPKQDRELIRLVGIQQLSYQEVGDRLGVSPQVIRRRIWRLAGRLARGGGV